VIEHPEVVVLAGQMNESLSGRVIEDAVAGGTPNKFVFIHPEVQAFQKVIKGKELGTASALGKWLSLGVVPGYSLQLGDLGGKILLHSESDPVPKKHHLLLRFRDRSFLTVAVQGWGFITLLEHGEQLEDMYEESGIIPTSPFFTPEYLLERAGSFGASKSIKEFLISSPGIAGIGNGYLQDILFRAGIHPRRKLGVVSADEMASVHSATVETLLKAIEKGGRDTESDLHGNPGGYTPLMDRRAMDRPCPKCGSEIDKISFMGGSCYFCHVCQT
jgi:formamidopyrimidine-DNA glycosylase